MKRFLCALASFLTVAAVPAAADDVIEIRGEISDNDVLVLTLTKKEDEIDRDKIVGVWEATKVAPGLPEGKWEFKKDGTVELSIEARAQDQNEGGINFHLATGKYEVEGNKLTVTLTLQGLGLLWHVKGKDEVTHKTTITKLTNKKFQTKDEKDKVCEFTKE